MKLEMNFSHISACFTGHREHKLGIDFEKNSKEFMYFKKAIYNKIIEAVENGYTYFYNGMAQGSDLYCAEAVIELREIYTDIKLEAVIPHTGQSNSWSIREKKKYNDVLDKCDKQTLIQNNYTKGCYKKRNQYMVDRSSLLIAIYNGSKGGSKNTIEYAKKKNINIVVIDPIAKQKGT